MENFKKFAYSTIIVLLCAYISGYFTQIGIDSWYNLSEKPVFTPPNKVFPIVWSILYLSLILSFYGILKNSLKAEAMEANNYFMTQLVLQIIWTFTFFYKGYLALGFLVILYLDYVVFKMLKVFKTISPAASYILYPYFLWLIFASALNLSFVLSNGMVIFE